MKKLEKKHPLAIRWFHWINFPVLFIMIWSGILIYWANDVYQIGQGKFAFHMFPAWFYKPLVLGGTTIVEVGSHLAEGMAWHFFFMWFFMINGLLYVLYTAFSGEWRHLLPNKNTFKEAFQVVMFDLFLSKTHPPRQKFNGAQRLAYTGVIVMGMMSLFTGLGIYKPVLFGWLNFLVGGYKNARFIHFWLTMGYCAFFMVHIAQVIRAGWNNFRAMVTGYEVVKVKESE